MITIDMEMPDKCRGEEQDCRFFIEGACYGKGYRDYRREMDHGKPQDCPLREVVTCKDCKHNPKDEWFGCPMSHLSETQRPEIAWCWKGEPNETDD